MHALHHQHGTGQMTARPIEAHANKTAEHLACLLAKVASIQCRVAYSELFQYFAPRLQAYAANKFGNQQLAADLVQETMTNVWLKAHLFHADRGSASTWVFTIARNTGFDYLRKKKHRLTDLSADELWPFLAENNDSLNDSASNHSSLDDKLLMEQISNYYKQLPNSQRIVIELIYIEGLSQQEVSDLLNVPLGTVKSRTRLGLQKLREMIDHD